MDIAGTLFIALIWPPLTWLVVPLNLLWTAPFALAAIAALIAGLIMAGRSGAGRSVLWLLLPLALAHIHVALSLVNNSDPVLWWLAVEALAIAWFVWTLRATLVPALLLSYFALIYCALPALALVHRLSLL